MPEDLEVQHEDAIKKRKNFLIGILVSFLITGVIFAGIILLEVFGLRRELKGQMTYLVFIDALTLSGGLMGAFYLLTLLSNQGVFDALVYSVKLAWVNTFHRNVREAKLAKNYHEYREEKKRGRNRNLSFIVIGAAPYLVAGLILMIPYYTLFR